MVDVAPQILKKPISTEDDKVSMNEANDLSSDTLFASLTASF